MTQPNADQKRDLVLHPGEYTYMQDQTRGLIKTHVGPTVINQTAQELPVAYDMVGQKFNRCSLEAAVVRGPLASEGEYIVLENPASDNTKPEEGSSKASPILKVGRKVNVPGPAQFALWPTQRATVVKGHHLRSNQYLLVRIYNEEEARQNWSKAVAVRATTEVDLTTDAVTTSAVDALGLTIGKLLIIKGTEVSFYIPPTGVEVISENNNYVREAVTLERLEYSILVDENGNKRYERGPQVVFPKPTESFYIENNNRKFKAIELNKIQGLHIKVIADYEEEDGNHKIGDEMFITGEHTPIYYPRVEHSIIRYGEKNKHYATALPAGEGRYVMNRETGEIKTECGPKMLLPDPRRQVIVRRVLSDRQVKLWYPGNEEALAYNQQLRALAHNAPSARSGFVSEGDVQRTQTAQRKMLSGSPPGVQNLSAAFPASTAQFGALADYGEEDIPLEATFLPTTAHQQKIGGSSQNIAGAALPDAFQRGTAYTQPRTVTLDTKYEGVPCIAVWTGYAVLVVSKTGERRVVTGPATILLNYDESLEVLELSTGKPKNTDQLEKTVYLRVANNKVSDWVSVKTKDLVDVTLKLSYRVNFEGAPEKWFACENYVKFLCDHVRSVLKGMSQKRKVEDFGQQGVDIVREAILGAAAADGTRSGMMFIENGMRVSDVEVLGIEVNDKAINEMLNRAQHEVVGANIKLHQAEKELEVTLRQEEITRGKAKAAAETNKELALLTQAKIDQDLATAVAKIKAELEAAQKQKEANLAKEEVLNVASQGDLQRSKAKADQDAAIETQKQSLRLEGIKAETESMTRRCDSIQKGFSEALLTLGNQDTLVKVAQALSVQQFVGGKDVVDVIQKLFAGSGMDGLLKTVTDRVVGNNNLTSPSQAPAGNRR